MSRVYERLGQKLRGVNTDTAGFDAQQIVASSAAKDRIRTSWPAHTPTQLEMAATAIHESGHAILGWSAGASILELRVRAEDATGLCRITELEKPEDRITFALVGIVAESKYNPGAIHRGLTPLNTFTESQPMPLDPISASAKRTAQRHLTSAADALKLMDVKEKRELSLLRGLESLKSRAGIDGYEREYLEERANIQGTDFDARHPVWPYSILATRATPLAAGQGGADGGYIVGTSTEQEVLDILRPYSPLLQNGVTIRTGLQENNVVPKMNGDVTGYWLNQETASITESEPLIGSIAISPKDAGVFTRFSAQLQRQAPNLEPTLRQWIARQIIQLVDTAAINGTGSAGQPLRLLNVAGIGAQSGAAYSHANSWTTRGTLAAANVNDQSIAWLGATNVRTVLATRERAAGDEYIWGANDQITGRAARVSTIVPGGTLIAGDFSQLVYAFFGDGFQIDVTPFNTAGDFQSGISAMRLLVAADIYLQHPTAFVAVTSVS